MKRARALLASLLVGGISAAGAIALATPAHAAVPGCADTVASFVVYADRVGAAYTINNRLVDYSTTTCYYTGDMYYSAGGQGTSYVGPYNFTRRRT